MKKAQGIGIEKIVALIIAIVILAIVIIFMMGDSGPLGWVKGIGSFMNSTTDYVTSK